MKNILLILLMSLSLFAKSQDDTIIAISYQSSAISQQLSAVSHLTWCVFSIMNSNNDFMKIEVNPKETSRAAAFSLWMSSPMPMVTLTKTLNVGRLLKKSKKSGVKFNTLFCWCIAKAATQIDEFYLLPEQVKLAKWSRSQQRTCCITFNTIFGAQ